MGRPEPHQAFAAGLDLVGLDVSDNKSIDCEVINLPETIPYWIAPMGHQSRMSMSHCKTALTISNCLFNN